MVTKKLAVFFFLLGAVHPKSFFSDFVNGKGPYKQDEALRFLGKMNELNRIQADILDVSLSSNDNVLNSTDVEQDEIQKKPDEIPYLFEGDMVLTDEQMDIIIRNAKDQYWARKSKIHNFLYAIRGKRSMTSQLSLRWTFPIPYYINAATGVDTNAVQAGVAKWQEETCARFTQLQSLPSSGNALEFISGSGCWSYIGKIGYSSQQVSIGVGCTSLGTVTHEIGHALGFYHEQARYDRDSYVTILTQNIQSTYLSQFTKQSFSSMVDYGVGYDYGSVMHYDQSAFTSNGGNTISTIDPNYQATIGQRVAPSFADVKRINLAYCNSTCSNTLDCQNGGYINPNDCNNCKCPPGFGGQLCNVAGGGDAACGTADLTATNTIQSVSASGAINCQYVITAPVGAKVFFQMTEATFSRNVPCTNYLEIKYDSDFTRVGARFCTSYPTISLSETNRLVLIYEGVSGARFSLNYRYDPQDFTTSTSSTTSTTTTTTTAAPTTTTAQKTTSTAKTTVTTTQKTTTSTPKTTVTTSTSAPTTTTSSLCGSWGGCSAQCGGCGTQTRKCGTYYETVYCNTNPCVGGYCCRPFFYVTQDGNGYCKRPQADDSEIRNEDRFEKAIHPNNDAPSVIWDNIKDHPKSRINGSNKGFAITN